MTTPLTARAVTTGELASRLAGGEPIALVDVRERVEWDAGHIPGALHLPMSELAARHEELRALPGPVHLVCRSGSRSARCAAFLAQAGHDVVDVLGGTGTWVGEGRPLAFG